MVPGLSPIFRQRRFPTPWLQMVCRWECSYRLHAWRMANSSRLLRRGKRPPHFRIAPIYRFSEGATMSAYVLVDIKVHDPAKFEEYKKLGPPSIGHYGGKYLARGGKVEVLDGEKTPERI